MIPSHGRLSDSLVRREGQDCDGTWWIRLLLGHCPPDRRGTTPLLGWPTRQCKDTKSVILWVRPPKAATTRSISEQGCFPRKDPRNLSTREVLEEAAAALFEVLKGGVVRSAVNHTHPLSEAAEAHRAIHDRRTTGSTVLLPFA